MEITPQLSIIHTCCAVIILFQASDLDSGKNSEFFFTLTNTSYEGARVIVDATSGLVRILSPVDYELVKSFEIAATVTDQGTPSLASTSYLTVVIQVNRQASYTKLHKTI